MGKTRTTKGETKVFIPFPAAKSAQHIQSAKTWRNVSAVDVFCADSPVKRNHLQALSNANDVLYIRGHCSKGSSSVESSDHSSTVGASDIVQLLVQDQRNPDLAFAFPGIVKVYACESALDDTTLWIFNNDAFAQRLADAMWAAGYRSCKYFGYGDTVSTWACSGSTHSGRSALLVTLMRNGSILVVRYDPCCHGVEVQDGISRTLQLAEESCGCLWTKRPNGACRPLNLGVPFEHAFLLEAR